MTQKHKSQFNFLICALDNTKSYVHVYPIRVINLKRVTQTDEITCIKCDMHIQAYLKANRESQCPRLKQIILKASTQGKPSKAYVES